MEKILVVILLVIHIRHWERFLGIDFKTFTQLVYQNTNTSLQFLTATDTNRKKFLIDLLKLDDYVAYFDTFKEAVRVGIAVKLQR